MVNIDYLIPSTRDLFRQAYETIKGAIDKAKEAISSVGQSVSQWWNDNVAKPVSSFTSWVSSGFSNPQKSVSNAWNSIVQKMTSTWQQMANSFANFQKMLGDWQQSITSAFSNVGTSINQGFKSFTEMMAQAQQNFFAMIGQAQANTYAAIAGFFNWISQGLAAIGQIVGPILPIVVIAVAAIIIVIIISVLYFMGKIALGIGKRVREVNINLIKK